MPITFGNTLNAPGNIASAATQAQPKRPKAKYWLNVGRSNPNSDVFPFASIGGIPLDESDLIAPSGSEERRIFQTLSNNLLRRTIERASQLQPGESVIFSMAGFPFEFQLRHVQGEQQEVESTESMDLNPDIFGSFEATATEA